MSATDTEIRRMIDIAQRATPGEWEAKQTPFRGCNYLRAPSGLLTSVEYSHLTPADAEHIAAVCPANIIPLLEELLALRGRS